MLPIERVGGLCTKQLGTGTSRRVRFWCNMVLMCTEMMLNTMAGRAILQKEMTPTTTAT